MESKEQAPASGSSIVNVAALAKVSTATVSRVLSGRRTKDDDIARRVRKAAEALNYSADYAASTLRSSSTNTLALVSTSPSNPFIARMLVALEAAASENGKELLVGLGDTSERQRIRIDALLSRKPDGLIVMPSTQDDMSAVLEKYASTTPTVQISGKFTSFHVNWVGVDNNAAMELALAHLTEHNAQYIAFFSASVNSSEAAEQFITFQTSASRLNLPAQPQWTTFGDCTVRRGYADALRIFSASDASHSSASPMARPDAVICASDDIALGVCMALDTLGLRVPEDVQIIGSGDTAPRDEALPSLTTTRPHYERIAKETLRLLEANSRVTHWLPAHTAFPPRLIARESTSELWWDSSAMVTPDKDL